MRKTVVALVATSLLAAGTAFAAGDEAVIKYRQSLMKGQSGHLGALFGIVKGGAGSREHMAVHAQALAAVSGMLIVGFEQRTEGGKTRAKPDIWSDWDGFKKAAMDMEKATADVKTAVASGDDEAIGAALGAAGDGCKGCHKKFRAKKK